MAKTNAERQASYKQRNLKSEDGQSERLDMVIDLHAKRALERLARHQSLLQRVILERLLVEAEQITVDKLAVIPDGTSEYYDGQDLS